MTERSARAPTGGPRSKLLIASLTVALVAAVWFAGTWTTTGTRDADLDRIAALAAFGALHAVLDPWTAFAASSARLTAFIAVLQWCTTMLVTALAYRAARSALLAAVAGLLTIASPFPEHWFGRPAGGADAVAVLSIVVVFGALADRRYAARARAVTAACAAFLAGALVGWAFVPVALAAAADRSRAAIAAAAGALIAVALRAALGVPGADVAGRFDADAPFALPAVRALVAVAFATPAAVFVLARSRGARSRALAPRESALLAAAAAAILMAGVLADPSPALFCAQIGVTLAAAEAAGRLGFDPVPNVRAIVPVGLAILVAGLLLRPPAFPPDDAAALARDGALVRAAGDRFVLVDGGRAAVRARYSPRFLARLAGRPVDVTYADAAPRRAGVPVLEASSDGLARIDDEIRRIATLDALRSRMRFDVLAAADRGVLNSRQRMPTPSGLGVVAQLPVAAPSGKLNATIVVSGFSITFPHVAVRPGDRLAYVIAKALPLGGVARGTVVVDVPGRPELRVADDLPPAPESGSLSWRLHVVALPVTAPASATIRFEASSPSGNGTGDWVAFGEPAVVAR